MENQKNHLSIKIFDKENLTVALLLDWKKVEKVKIEPKEKFLIVSFKFPDQEEGDIEKEGLYLPYASEIKDEPEKDPKKTLINSLTYFFETLSDKFEESTSIVKLVIKDGLRK